MTSNKIQGFILYQIYYGDALVYLGRTKQPLQDRLRGHFFQKPMHRKISIELTTKILYSEFQTEADMNLYEIYYILTKKPPLNVDDTTRDFPTVSLPDVEWKEWRSPIFDKWLSQIQANLGEYEKKQWRLRELPEEMRVIRNLFKNGEISADERQNRLDDLHDEYRKLCEEMR